MSATLIAAIVVAVIGVVGGASLIVSLSGPLAGVKELFMAVVDLICNNAIWFFLSLLIFIIAFTLIKRVSVRHTSSVGFRQQKIDNDYRQASFEARQRQLDIDNHFRQDEFIARQKQQKINNKFRKQNLHYGSKKQEFTTHKYKKKDFDNLWDDLDNVKLY